MKDVGMSMEDARVNIKSLVRINPVHGGNKNGPHWGRGRIVGVTRRTVIVDALGSKGTRQMEVEPQYLKLWHAQAPAAVAGRPTENHDDHKEMTTMKPTDARTAAPAVPAPTAPSPAPAAGPPPRMDEVLQDLTRLTNLAKSNRTEIEAAEYKVLEADEAIEAAKANKQKAEQALAEQQGRLEAIKSKIRGLRAQLDAVLEDI